MKLLRLITLTSLLLISLKGNTQINQGKLPLIEGRNTPFQGEKCASSYMDEYMLRTNPAYRIIRNQIENHTQQLLQNATVTRSGGVNRGVIYTIPLVFHIMHSGEAIGDSTNISDAQIQSCIAALNRDFRHDSTVDGGIATSGPLGVDAEIEFCLAQRDPNGNYTSGITRHDMSGNQGYLDSGVYHNATQWRHDASLKNLVRWNPAQYLNVWVVNKIKTTTNIYAGGGGGVIGYATFPGSSSASDGVVIRFSSTGNDITGIKGFNLWSATTDNTVLTHELGHYLNLYHTFQGGSCAAESNCNTMGDRCCDTPPTTVGTGNNCVSPQCSGAENKENYMQYQNGACNSDFTPNQVSRMRAVLASGGARHSLTTNLNCISPHQYNPTLAKIIYPDDSLCTIAIPGFILVCNGGNQNLTSFRIKYDIDFGTIYTYNWTGNMTPSDCDTIILPVINTTTGNHSYNVRIDSTGINGINPDGLPADNSLSSGFNATDGNPVIVDILTDCHANEISWTIRDSSGNVVKTGGGYSVGLQHIFEETCLDSGCYTFTIYDSFGNGLAKQGFCPRAGNYKLTDVKSGQTVAIMQSNPNYGDSVVHNFCLPFNAVLNPGFTGCDTVYPGYPVFFTDTTVSIPTANSWNWSFGDGSSSILQNPSHRYALPGTYNVKLKATNAALIDSITKPGCVVVIPTPPGFCDTLYNYTPFDTLITYELFGSWGLFPGHNGAFLKGYAEPFTISSPTNTIQRIELLVSRAYAGTPTSSFALNVYADNGGKPGVVLSSDTILISSLAEGVLNQIYLTTPPSVTGSFWAGFEIDYSNGDTLAITTASNRITGINTTFVKTGAAIWESADSIARIKTSLGLRVIFTDLPASASLGVSNRRICQGNSTTFTAGSPTNYDSLTWYFPGGIPSTSTNLTQSVTYSTAGRYKAILYLEGICSNDSLITYIDVDATAATASFTESALAICEQDSIKFNGTVSGTGTIQWTFTGGTPALSGQEDDTVIFNTAGIYNVKLKFQNGCGSDSVTKTVNVKAYPTTTVTPADTTICAGQSVTLTSVGGSSFQWSNSSSTSSTTVTPSTTTNYWVASNNGVCIGDTAYSVVRINIIPTIVANATPVSVCLGTPVYFSMTGSNAITYDWNFGDLNTSTLPNVNHTYAAAGTYNATLKGIYGVCDNTDNITINVRDCTGLEEYEMSKAISVYPNPANRVLNIGILDAEIKELDLKLFNSTGKLVYQKSVFNTKNNIITVDLSEFSTGLYLMRFNTGKNVFSKQIVITK